MAINTRNINIKSIILIIIVIIVIIIAFYDLWKYTEKSIDKSLLPIYEIKSVKEVPYFHPNLNFTEHKQLDTCITEMGGRLIYNWQSKQYIALFDVNEYKEDGIWFTHSYKYLNELNFMEKMYLCLHHLIRAKIDSVHAVENRYLKKALSGFSNINEEDYINKFGIFFTIEKFWFPYKRSLMDSIDIIHLL